MDYLEAESLFMGRNRNRPRRKLAYKTYLYLAESEEAEDFGRRIYQIALFGTYIITFRAKGQVELADGDMFARTTNERFNRFLPRGWQVWGQWIRGIGTVGFIKTQAGIFHYKLPMTINANGLPTHIEEACPGIQEGWDFQREVEELPSYRTNYLRLFYSGKLERPAPGEGVDNIRCRLPGDQAPQEYPAALMNTVLKKLGGPTARRSADLYWRDAYVRWHRPKTMQEAADVTAYLLNRAGQLPPLPDPGEYGKVAAYHSIKKALMECLIEGLGVKVQEWNRR